MCFNIFFSKILFDFFLGALESRPSGFGAHIVTREIVERVLVGQTACRLSRAMDCEKQEMQMT